MRAIAQETHGLGFRPAASKSFNLAENYYLTDKPTFESVVDASRCMFTPDGKFSWLICNPSTA